MEILPAEYHPPARRGDFYRLLATGVETIVLVDGVFHGEPSVLHREIYDVINEGLRVYGCSSMGALRAAELEAIGMVGHGRVFELYRDGIIDGDDEVALLHGPEETNFQPLSEPLVNFRVTLWEAADAGLIPRELADGLIEEAKQTFYPERSWRQLGSSALLGACSASTSAVLKRMVAQHGVNVKQRDALSLLRWVAAGDLPPAADSSRQLDVSTIETYPERAALRRVRHAGRDVELGGLLARVHDQGWIEKLRRPLVIRWFVADWARQRGAGRSPRSAPDASTAEARSSDPSWLIEQGLTASEYRAWRVENGIAQDLMKAGPEQFGLPVLSGQDPSHPFLVDWRRLYGVLTSTASSFLDAQTSEMLAEELIDAGPERFGFFFDLEMRVLRELQCTGRLGALLC